MKLAAKFRIFEDVKTTILLLALPIILTHCNPKDSLKTSNIQPSFSSIYENVLSKNCVGCHEPQGMGTVQGAQIDFSSKAIAYQTLTSSYSSGTASNSSGQCSSVPLVSAGHPESSYMLATLFTDYHHSNFGINGCTPHSPSAHGATVDSSEKDAIVNWIQNGAQNN